MDDAIRDSNDISMNCTRILRAFSLLFVNLTTNVSCELHFRVFFWALIAICQLLVNPIQTLSRGGYFASLRAQASSREPLFASPESPAKKSKNGHDALIWYLYMRARPLEENVR